MQKELNDFLAEFKFDPNKDLINEGGFGKIYRAWGEHDREVAIKVCQVQNHKYTLKREFELASKLARHPNIAFYEAVYEFDVPGVGIMEYAVMQYYPEGDLRRVMQNYKLSDEERLDILKGVLQGVDFLHSSGIIHRDLKPGNILMQKVQGKWRPKITDFGLGKSFVGGGEVSNTSAGIVSLLYASPEQILGKATYTNTDLWPVGIITYFLATGRVPFESALPKETESYRADLTRKIVAGLMPDDVASLPEPFKAVCLQCLVVDNTQRVQQAAALLDIVHYSTGLLCSQCGAKLTQAARFCTVCGKAVARIENKQESKPVIQEENTAVIHPAPQIAPTPLKTVAAPPPTPIASRTTLAPHPVKRKGISAFGWILIILAAAAVLVVSIYFVSKSINDSYGSKNNKEKTSESDNSSESDDPFEGMSDYEINQKGESYYSRGDYVKAKKYFKKAANEGYVAAKRNLGILYMTVDGDYDRAFNELTEAADLGDADAMFNLGLMYERGYVDGYSNMDMANYWYEMSGYSGTEYDATEY